MGAHLVEPGAVLADRYVVEDLLTQQAACESWRARDRILARSVVLQILPSTSPYASHLLAAAKRASRVTDTRILQVLDAVDDGDLAYVVREWAAGQSLDMVLGNGPLTPHRAAWLVREVASAIVNAHVMGLPHRRLAPNTVVLTKSSGVKLIGLGTEAALQGNLTDDDDPELEDVLDLGRLLYACLTARWPGGNLASLVEAPTEHGRLLRPRQVRAGVPRTLDGVCDRILGQQSRYGEPITSVTEIKDTLTAMLAQDGFNAATGIGLTAPATDSSPQFEPPPALLSRDGDPPAGEQAAYPAAPPAERPPSLGRTLGWTAVAVLALAAILLAYLVGQNGTDVPPSEGSATSTPTTPDRNRSTSSPKPLDIVGVTTLDPLPAGSGDENPEIADLAVDDDPATVWETKQYFNNAALGLQKDGVGLVVDLGKVQRVSSVDVTLQGDGTNLELRTAPESADTAPVESVDDYDKVASVEAAGAVAHLELDRPISTQYVLVWLTSLPPDGTETYRGRIAEIEVVGG